VAAFGGDRLLDCWTFELFYRKEKRFIEKRVRKFSEVLVCDVAVIFHDNLKYNFNIS
jgi:hypothetical protein